MIKTPRKLGTERNFLNLTKGRYGKTTANIPNSECFLPEIENETRMSVITLFCCSHFFHHCAGDSDQCDKARKKQ